MDLMRKPAEGCSQEVALASPSLAGSIGILQELLTPDVCTWHAKHKVTASSTLGRCGAGGQMSIKYSVRRTKEAPEPGRLPIPWVVLSTPSSSCQVHSHLAAFCLPVI